MVLDLHDRSRLIDRSARPRLSMRLAGPSPILAACVRTGSCVWCRQLINQAPAPCGSIETPDERDPASYELREAAMHTQAASMPSKRSRGLLLSALSLSPVHRTGPPNALLGTRALDPRHHTARVQGIRSIESQALGSMRVARVATAPERLRRRLAAVAAAAMAAWVVRCIGLTHPTTQINRRLAGPPKAAPAGAGRGREGV